MPTVIDQQPFDEYTGNGVTTLFAYEFQVLEASDLMVKVAGDVVASSEYTLTGVGGQTGGTVEFNSAPANGVTVLLARDMALERATDYQEQGDLLADTVNHDFNRLWLALQQQRSSIKGALRAPFPELVDELPSAAERALRVLAFNSLGQPMAIPGVDSGSAAALALDLANKLSASKGAGQIGRGVQVVGSIAELRGLLKTSVSTNALVAGYYAPSGGGGGHYCFDASDTTSTDNGGTVIVATDGGRWKLANIETVTLSQFGVVGDGVADDTNRLKAALAWGYSANRILYGKNLCVKITSAIVINGPGIVFDSVSYGGTVGMPGIYISGTGYTGVTITAPEFLRLTVWGLGQTANAVLLQNPILLKECHLRVYNFDGFGCKINKVWDSLFQTISVEKCGNSSEYAFSMNDDGDTCNMTHILRLQVEQAKAQAIYISPNSLSCVIDNIHSERATPEAGKTTWVLGGNRNLYNSIRLQSIGTVSDSSVMLAGANSTYTSLQTDSATPITFDFGISGAGGVLVNPEITGSLTPVSGSSGKLKVFGGRVAVATADVRIIPYGTAINNITPELTFTPQLKFGGANVGITYSTQAGVAERIGNQVLWSIELTLTSKGTSTGAATFTGLPWASRNSSPISVANAQFENLTYSGAEPQLILTANSNQLGIYADSSGGPASAVTNTAFANNTTIRASGSYFV